MTRTIYSLFFLMVATFSYAQTTIEIKDGDLQGNQTYNWTNDNVYLLDGFVYLEEGGVLNIEAGTVIKAKAAGDLTTGDNASALIITRGAQIFATGTANEPIIFTAEADDITTPADSPSSAKGLWGGLIVLGDAVLGDGTTEVGIEGIPSGEARALYGGNNDDDNSGVISYISIRHGGATLAGSPGNEINGLTLGGVGSGTQIDHVEVYANFDDGIEFFGGTVDVKYAVVAFCGDDSYDYDTGWRGRGQYWVSIQEPNGSTDNAGEHDGAKPDDNTRFSQPVIYNATYIGSGTSASAKNEHALLFRDGTGGTYANSIFTEFANFAIQVEDLGDPTALDARQRMENGELNLLNNIWFEFGEGSELNAGANGIIVTTAGAEDPNAQFLIDHLTNNNNELVDPQLANINRAPNQDLDLRPSINGPAYENLADIPDTPDNFFEEVPFKGAFGATNWLRGWTALEAGGFIAPQEQVVITDEDLEGGQTYNWTDDNIYLLDGFVYLESGGKLNIGPGTVIQAKQQPSTNELASTLIITRGAQIMATGTADDPIIFTTEIDDVTDPNDVPILANGLWGGLIILGNAVIGDNTTEVVIEGLPVDESRALYGGNDDADNSGMIQYVSIRHGGAALAPGNEINGLTLGGVGSGTLVENVEVYGNFDDGIELFGGTVDVKWAMVAFCGDDSYDYDTGWRGKGQFWVSLQSSITGDNAGEHDGAKPDDNARFSQPTIYNATYIGSGVNSNAKNEHALLFRDGTGGTYANSIFTDFANFAIQVEDLPNGLDSRQRMENGELSLLNNIWSGFGEGSELNAGSNGIIQATDNAEDPNAQFLIDHLANNMNTLEDPQLGGISRTNDGGLDPRPADNGPAYTNMMADLPANDDFYSNVEFSGAFCSEGVWINGWTAVSAYGILGDIPSAGADCGVITSTENLFVEDKGYILGQTSPNPTNGYANLTITLPKTAEVNLQITDMSGRVVAMPIIGQRMAAGEHWLDINVAQLPNGIYTYTLLTNEVAITKRMIVSH